MLTILLILYGILSNSA